MSLIDENGSIIDPYRNFIHVSRYSRWIEEKGRRETWVETVDRYIDFMKDHLVKNYNYKGDDIKFSQVREAILNHNVMPSMRSLMTAGSALERDHIAAYNCSFIAVDSLRSFDEAMYILMNGTGVGFSVEQKYVDNLPVIAEELFPTNTTIVVEDSKLGWAKAYKELIGLLVTGQIPNWDMSKVRPAGARLKTFGGRASGPEPLSDLFKFTVEQFKIAKGRRLKPIEAHDIMCKVGEVVVVGGVRRSALISLSNLDDFEMAKAKSGQWWETEGQRALANNSAVYNSKPNTAQFLREWRNLYESKSGERGIYNMDSVRKHTDKFGRRDSSKVVGTNPCLTGDSMLLTENGWISFNEAYRNGKKNNIVVDGRVSYDSSKGEEELAGNWILDKKNKYSPKTMQASEVFLTQKNAYVVKIETTGGYSVRLTPDHLVMTKNGMIEAGKLNPGDKIFITRGYLPEESLGIPETLEEKEAILMGLIAGDGTFTKHKTKRDVSHIVLWGKDKWIAEEVVGWIQDIQDINELDINPLGNKKFSNSHILNIPLKDKVEVRSTFLSAHLEKKYGFNAESKHTVPNHFIQYAASRKARFYVAALAFCDGTVNKYNKVGSCSARINQSNKKMLSDVQLILLANGINSSVYSRRPAKSKMMPDGKGGRKKYFTKENFELVVMANAYEFSRYVGFLGGYKQELAERIFTRSRKQNTYATVKSVNPDGNEDVFCLKEDERRILCANGITMRRCGEILLRANEFCVTGSTPIITKSGIIDIKDLEDKTVDVWNGEEWSEVTVVKTRENASLVRVTISDGSTLDCTPDHKFSVKDRFSDKWSQVEARSLMSSSRYSVQIEPTTIVQDDDGINVDESYTLGFAVGDGCSYGGVVFVDLYGDKDQSCPVTGTRYKKYLPKKYNLSRQRVRTNIDPEFFGFIRDNFREVSTWNKNSALNFIAGLADADGSETGTGGIRIYISAEDRAKDLQLILTRFGIRSSVNLLAKAGKRTNLGTRKRDLWYLQITDPRDIPCFRLNVSKGHSARFKGKYQNVRSVDILDTTEDVYCFNEPKRHMAVFGNILTYQCNLTEVVIDEKDTEETLKDKIQLATILGTWQSSLTNFKYIRKSWKDNCEEERLLGVSLTGIFGNPITGTVHKGLGDMLDRLRESAVEENKKEAEVLGINASVAITTVKPSGTVSQLTGVSSGIHPWYSEYYIRTVRADNKDPLTAFLKDFNVPNEPDVMKPEMTTVFSFPIKSPKNAVVTKDVSAIEHLEIWKVYRTHWTEHNPSVTISVKEDEWLDVGAWVFKNFNSIGGVSFLPASEHSYKQAPYQEITKDKYEELLSKMPKNIPWQSLPLYELEDNTTGSQELACAAGADSCDVVDLVSA